MPFKNRPFPGYATRRMELGSAARQGRRDGAAGIPFERTEPPNGNPDLLWDWKQSADFIFEVEMRLHRRRERALAQLMRRAEPAVPRVCAAAAEVVKVAGLLRDLERDGDAGGEPPDDPVEIARRARQDARRERRREVLRKRFEQAGAAYDRERDTLPALVKWAHPRIGQATAFANETVGRYRVALVRAYKKKAGDGASIPLWDPPAFSPDPPWHEPPMEIWKQVLLSESNRKLIDLAEECLERPVTDRRPTP